MSVRQSTVTAQIGCAAVLCRWYIPVGAVSVHICIGSVYAWSTFNRPIQTLLPGSPWWFSPPYTTFITALVLLGLSAAFGGTWVERRGPRVAATAAAVLFGLGLIIGCIGLALAQPLLVFLGMGVIGGIVMVLGVVYFVIMMAGAWVLRRPPEGWRPEGWKPPVRSNHLIRTCTAADSQRFRHSSPTFSAWIMSARFMDHSLRRGARPGSLAR